MAAKRKHIVTLSGVVKAADGKAITAKTHQAADVAYFHGKMRGFTGAMHDVFVRVAGKCIEVTTPKGKTILRKHATQGYYTNNVDGEGKALPKGKEPAVKIQCTLKAIVGRLTYWDKAADYKQLAK